jgi:hypothetical protein
MDGKRLQLKTWNESMLIRSPNQRDMIYISSSLQSLPLPIWTGRRLPHFLFPFQWCNQYLSIRHIYGNIHYLLTIAHQTSLHQLSLKIKVPTFKSCLSVFISFLFFSSFLKQLSVCKFSLHRLSLNYYF